MTARSSGVSVDPVDDHVRWSKDIEETQGVAPNYPMIGDHDLAVAKLYGMLPASAGDSAAGRTPADNATVRNVFVIGPDKKIKLVLVYPMSTGRNFAEILRALDFAPAHREAPGGDTGRLAAGWRRDHRHLGVRRGGQGQVPGRLEGAQALPADRAAAWELIRLTLIEHEEAAGARSTFGCQERVADFQHRRPL